MTAKENQILETFREALPKLTDRDKEKLLAFGEGLALATRQTESKAS